MHPPTRARVGDALAGLDVLNPLPVALAHYEQALRSLLDGSPGGVDVAIEASGRSRLGRVLLRLAATLRLLRAAGSTRPTLVLWPSYGLAEIALWRLSRGHRMVIVHDPVPLRSQVGYGALGRRLARWGSRGRRVEVVAHTELAAAVLRDHGIACSTVLPHPVMLDRRATGATATTPTVLVAGQCKEVRDLELLTALAALLPAGWDLRVRGRGWPALEGWDVEDRFLPEADLDAELARAHAVLIPYDYYFQSGIATRAFEVGTPVVARRHEFVEQLYGRDWPGTVETERVQDWQAVLERVVSEAPPVPHVVVDDAATQWRTTLTSLAAEGEQ